MTSMTSMTSGSKGPRNWFERVRKSALQEPLIETRPTLAALESSCATRSQPPRTVFVGIGVCSRHKASRALPIDVLGLLLPAERIRRVVGAASTVVVVADAHAASNGVDSCEVRARTRQTIQVVERVRAAILPQIRIVRASSFHSSATYRELLAEARRRAPQITHPYFLYEAADIEYMDRRQGGIIKVGWSIDRSGKFSERRQDEVAFDRRFSRWFGAHVPFVYCKAGRTLDPRRPKACPYVAEDPRNRICLNPDEQVKSKIASARQVGRRALRNHLKRIARCYDDLIAPLSGPTEQRIQMIISHIFDGAAVEHRMTA